MLMHWKSGDTKEFVMGSIVMGIVSSSGFRPDRVSFDREDLIRLGNAPREYFDSLVGALRLKEEKDDL